MRNKIVAYYRVSTKRKANPVWAWTRKARRGETGSPRAGRYRGGVHRGRDRQPGGPSPTDGGAIVGQGVSAPRWLWPSWTAWPVTSPSPPP